MKSSKDTIAVQHETGFRRDSHAEAPSWELMYQTLLAEIDLRVEDAVARALSDQGLAPPPIGGVVINTRKNRPGSAVLGPATREARTSGEGAEGGRPSSAFGSSALPPWVQPFAVPEKVRYTRTPDSFLRAPPPPEDHGRPPPAHRAEDTAAEPSREIERVQEQVIDAETLMNAGTPNWRIPVTLPPNVRFNRTPLRRNGEDALPQDVRPQPAPTAMPAPEALIETIEDDPRPQPQPAAAEPGDEAILTQACVAEPAALGARTAPDSVRDPLQAPGWFDFFGAACPDEAEDEKPSAMLMPRPMLLLAPPVPVAKPPSPAWFDFFGAVAVEAAREQDADAETETVIFTPLVASPLPCRPAGPSEAVPSPEREPVGVAAGEVIALGFWPVVEIVAEPSGPAAADRTDAGTVLAPDAIAGTDGADDVLAAEAAALFGLDKPPADLPKPTGIASPDDARAFAGPPRDITPRKPTPASHGLAPFNMTNAITVGSEEWVDPPLDVLVEPPQSGGEVLSSGALEQNARLLEGVLEEFGIRGEIIDVRPGPVVTLYEFEPAPGTKSSRVIGLSDDVARSMSAVSARVAVVQGRNVIGIELPNQKRETVFLREIIDSEDFQTSKHRLAIALGKTIGGESVIVDLARMPHLLVAGTTGSGKSVAINTMILSILYRLRPDECRLIMVDPKMLELSVYEGIPHLLTPVVTDPKKAVVALKWAVREMEDRYKKMSKVGVRNIDGFNARVGEAAAKDQVITRTVQTGYNRETGQPIFETEEMVLECLPYIVIVVDEMADLMMVAGKDIEGAIQRLAQMARAAGIHLIMATQRPSVDVITGTIKANFPTRISFQVTSKIDSRTILGEQGAEQLLGQGDMLYMAGGGRISRVHGPFVSDGEVEKVVAHLKTQGHPAYLDVVVAEEDGSGEGKAEGPDEKPVFERGTIGAAGDDDAELYDQAVKVVLRDKKCSTSYIQRRLQVGYNKAASLVERMEKEGIVGQANNAGKREILVYSRDLRFTEARREGEE
jgi:hypothetical protein